MDDARQRGETTDGAPRSIIVVTGDDRLGRSLTRSLGVIAEGPVHRWCGAADRAEEEISRLAGAADPPRSLVYAAASRGGDGLPDPEDAAAVLAACGRLGIRRAVVLSSTEIYAPSPHHPGMIDEARGPLKRGRNAVADRWLDLEEVVDGVADDVVAITVLRCAPVPLPGGDDFFSRLLAPGSATATLPGRDPTLQLLAVHDLASAVGAALERSGRGPYNGPYNIVPGGSVPLRQALRLAGARRVALPGLLHPLFARRPAGGIPHRDRLDFLRYSWTAAGEAAHGALGWLPRWTSGAVARWLAAGGEPDAPPPEAPRFDDFGIDHRYIARFGSTLFRFLHDVYWRVEHRGLEHVPRSGRAVLAGVHRGFMPWDGVMALHLLVREIGRAPRFLLHPSLLKFPFLFNYMTKLGGVMACQENAARVLGSDQMLGIFPEGIHGAFTPYRRAYRLGRFGRDEFVRMALRNRAPIVPFVTVGSAEIFPILGRVDWRWWKRLTLWPYLPITPTFPWLPVPLPSKWHTRFLAPLHVEREHGPEAADDPAVVAAISHEVRRRMREAIAEMLARRRSIFFGSAFAAESGSELGERLESS
ncbi:MAG TPA: 1-acyl-sn-glycerol-3-phosphate acyltransferase [Thermoanaerobaculia bacterium]|nr:1-acyl-sn-glycerol-3-phosphate acyltransferase [Thermoanaerobaculia bacterium]